MATMRPVLLRKMKVLGQMQTSNGQNREIGQHNRISTEFFNSFECVVLEQLFGNFVFVNKLSN
jgi:hypothetical protein